MGDSMIGIRIALCAIPDAFGGPYHNANCARDSGKPNDFKHCQRTSSCSCSGGKIYHKCSHGSTGSHKYCEHYTNTNLTEHEI